MYFTKILFTIKRFQNVTSILNCFCAFLVLVIFRDYKNQSIQEHRHFVIDLLTLFHDRMCFNCHSKDVMQPFTIFSYARPQKLHQDQGIQPSKDHQLRKGSVKIKYTAGSNILSSGVYYYFSTYSILKSPSPSKLPEKNRI